MSRFAVLIVILALIVLFPIVVLLAVSGHTSVHFDPQPKAIGVSTPVKLKLDNPHGVREVKVYLEQDGSRTQLFDESKPATRLMFWRKSEAPREVTFTASAKKEGKARLVAEAVSNDLRGSTDRAVADVEVILRPPSVSTDGLQHYINQGGSELVSFTPGGFWTEAGVRTGKYTFRSFPKPGNPNERFALFGFPWDVPADTAPYVFVRNPAGAEAQGRFPYKVFPKAFRKRDLELSDAFLEKVVNDIDPGGSGDLLTRFLKINGEMRRANNQTLAGLRNKTEEKFLWSEPFEQLSNSKVESQFADVRSYIYKGKKVDEQVHLGFDLSVTQHVPVVAANSGRVVYADRLGIYGNCIVVDHGYGLQSIYGHLSSIGVKAGDMVKRGQEMGRSGSTGLAGGDHLHFSMQLDGVQVNPVEWWDGHWIQDHVFSRVQPGGAN
jgi:murein DD-endopeptidase MepM/ murein hydrolase activator NlpD